jgi:hypothetical protein
MRLQIYLLSLRNTNKHFWRHCWGVVVVVSLNLVHSCIFYFILSFLFIFSPMEQPTIENLSTPKGELIELPQSSKPIIASSYELHPGFIAMVQNQAFSGLDYENPYHHLREFEQLCACLTILGMS